jgi:hypothetical protein
MCRRSSDESIVAMSDKLQLPFLFFKFLNPLLEGANIAARRSDRPFVLNFGVNALFRTKTSSRTRIANRTSAVAADFTIATLSTGEGSRLSRSCGSLSARRSRRSRGSGRGRRRLCPCHALKIQKIYDQSIHRKAEQVVQQIEVGVVRSGQVKFWTLSLSLSQVGFPPLDLGLTLRGMSRGLV